MSQNNPLTLQNPARAAGILLVASLLIPLLALIILATSGAFAAFAAGLQGSLAEKAPHAATFRQVTLLYVAGWIIQPLGFSLLARLLLRRGMESLVIPAFIAVLLAAILGVFHGTFYMSVEPWAAEQAARSGSVPAVYKPLHDWVGSSFRVGYIAHLAGTAGFGWGLLRARLLAPWVGQISIGWGLLWLAGYLVGVGAPGILFIMPAAIGVELARRG